MNFAHAEVATLDPTTMRTLCEEYMANNYIDPETSERLGVKRGLRNPDGTGVLAGLTNVCDVVGYKKDQEGHIIPIPGKLIYRGVPIDEIVEEAYRNDRFVFEEVIWLLLFGSLPTQEQLDAADRYAEALGLAFQTRDDMLDVLGDSGKMGKATGMDENKNTFVRLYGVGACSRLIEKETQKAIEALGAFEDSDFLKELSMKLAIREC